MYRLLFWGVLGAMLAACSLPRGAAMQSEVLRGAEAEERSFQLVPLTRSTLSRIARWPAPAGSLPEYRPWPGRGLREAGPLAIAPGDLIDLTIYDTEENSLLTSGNERASTLQQLPVSPDGTLFLPYAGPVKVSGLTVEAARTAVQNALIPSLPSAQVLLAQTPGRRNRAEILSGAAAPGSYPLPDRGFPTLSLISLAGGVHPGLRNPVLRLMRDGQSYGIPLRELYEQPQTDIALRGGDRLILEEDQRRFLALGASGVQSAIPFPRRRVTAMEALTLTGGIAPARADPRGILLLRNYPPRALRTDGSGPDREQVVFALDLTTAEGLFAARHFEIADGDLLLATESPVSNTRTVFSLIGQVFGLAGQLQP